MSKKIPSKTIDRYKAALPPIQRVLKAAKDRDINEADTVAIVQGILADVFGFDRYLEVTSEYAIRSTYCDLAVKIDEKIQYLVEVKAIGLELKEIHLKQAVDYAANNGTQWVALTNGIHWQVHRIRFERPIGHKLVAKFDLLELNPRRADDQEKLFLLSKRGLATARQEYYERSLNVNRFVIGAMLFDESVVSVIKKNVRKMAAGIKVSSEEIEKVLHNEVIKRDVIEGDDASKAAARIKRALRKSNKRSMPREKKTPASPTEYPVHPFPPHSRPAPLPGPRLREPAGATEAAAVSGRLRHKRR